MARGSVDENIKYDPLEQCNTITKIQSPNLEQYIELTMMRRLCDRSKETDTIFQFLIETGQTNFHRNIGSSTKNQLVRCNNDISIVSQR